MVNNISRMVWSRCISRAFLLLVALAVHACGQSDADVANGDDPIKALAVPHVSERYNIAYWTQTMELDEDLWTRAVRLCEGLEGDLRENPNCHAVLQVKQFEQVPEIPLDQPRTFSLTPKPWDQDTTDTTSVPR